MHFDSRCERLARLQEFMNDPEKYQGIEIGPGDMSHDDWEACANNWSAPSVDASGRVKREPRFPFSRSPTRPRTLREIPLQNKALRAFVKVAKKQRSQPQGDYTSITSSDNSASEQQPQLVPHFAVTCRHPAAGGVNRRPIEPKPASPYLLRLPQQDSGSSMGNNPPTPRPARRLSNAESVSTICTEALVGASEPQANRYLVSLEARLRIQFPGASGPAFQAHVIEATMNAYGRAVEADKARREAQAKGETQGKRETEAIAAAAQKDNAARAPVRGGGRTRGKAPKITVTRNVTSTFKQGPVQETREDDLAWSRPQIAGSSEKPRGKPPAFSAHRSTHGATKPAVKKKPEEEDAWGPAPVHDDDDDAWGAAPSTSKGFYNNDAWGTASQRSAPTRHTKLGSSQSGSRPQTTYSSDSDADADFTKAPPRRLQPPALPSSSQSMRSSSGNEFSQAGRRQVMSNKAPGSLASKIQPSPYKPPQSFNPYGHDSDSDAGDQPRFGMYDDDDSSDGQDITRSGLTNEVKIRKVAPTGEASQWTSRFECNMEGCGFNCTTLKIMIGHKIDNHFVCLKCDQEFKDAGSLRMHKQISASHNVCWTCETDFNTTTARNRHIDAAHPSKKELQCPGCGITYPNQTSFILHFEQKACPQITEAQFQKARDMIGNINHVDVVEVVGDNQRQPENGEGPSHRAAVPGFDPLDSNYKFFRKLPGSRLLVDDQTVSAAGATPDLVKKLENTTLGGPMTSIALLPREQRLFQLHQRIFGPNRKKGPEVPRNSKGEILISAIPGQPAYNPRQFYSDIFSTYLCPYPKCTKRLKTENALDAHIRSPAHSNDNLRCPECHDHFKSGASLVAHIDAPSTNCYVRNSEIYKEITEVISGAFLSVQETLDGREEIVVQQPTW